MTNSICFICSIFRARNRERFGGFAPNSAAREFVRTMREQLRDIMDRHGAVHSQIGRFYRMNASGVPGDLLSRLKRALDPHHRLNPGVLGLPQAGDAPIKPS